MPSVERVNWAKLRVGVVSAAAVAILLTLAYLLAGGTIFTETATLFLFIPDATGLGPGAPVRLGGIGIGRVESVSLGGGPEPNRTIRVVLLVERARLSAIPSDSFAELGAETLIGDRYVDITIGKATARLRAGTELPFREPSDLLKTLDLQQFEQQLRIVDATVTDIEQGRSRVGQFVKGDKMYSDLRRQLAEAERGFKAALSTTNQVGRALYTTALYDRISEPLTKLDASLARLQSGQGAGGRFLRDAAQYEQLRTSLASIRKTAADLRSGPFLGSDELYNDWNRRVNLMIRSVDEMNSGQWLLTSAFYDNLNGAAAEMQTTLKELRENPKKYLRLKVF